MTRFYLEYTYGDGEFSQQATLQMHAPCVVSAVSRIADLVEKLNFNLKNISSSKSATLAELFNHKEYTTLDFNHKITHTGTNLRVCSDLHSIAISKDNSEVQFFVTNHKT